MKHIIILGDGMADHAIERLGGKTPLQYARPEYMNRLARMGRTGRLVTVPDHFPPGSEVANTAILGYDLNKVYEGRGPLEAASIGYDMQPGDFAIRCNLITLEDGKIVTHNGGNLQTEDARMLIDYLNEHLGNDRVQFICGIQYRHLLVIKGGNKHIDYWIQLSITISVLSIPASLFCPFLEVLNTRHEFFPLGDFFKHIDVLFGQRRKKCVNPITLQVFLFL
jgi:2,3-bisphosphoglycerate-independent phosphoglycerate mutase